MRALGPDERLSLDLDAEVFVDGNYVGQVKALRVPETGSILLAPGVHRVEVRKPGRFPVQRTVTMKDGREFEAFTYGLRELVPTRANIAIQGIAVDGKLALTELPGRILEPVEVADLNAKNEVCPTSGVVTSTTNEEVVVDWDGADPTFFCGPKHALDELLFAANGDASAGGGVVAQAVSTRAAPATLNARNKKAMPPKIGGPASHARRPHPRLTQG